ncbi:MAG: PilT/PilU family type 4a pilus ATPase [Clostridium sp.]|nr:PilT/PilU family type 4a pilus ATPase [Clostridium sp.]
MYCLKDLLLIGIKMHASDIHLYCNAPPVFRVNGELIKLKGELITSSDTKSMVEEILKESIIKYKEAYEYDTTYEINNLGRFRVNVFKEKGNDAIELRIINNDIPSLEDIHCPEIVKDFTKENSGLILVTGCTGSGKSTSIASMINEINNTRACHIITLEDPIEYIFENNKSIINQREIGRDTKDFDKGLKASLREDPDVIFIGEVRNGDEIRTAIKAAETGHLVLTTLHTMGAVETIERIINAFPKEEQNEIKIRLSMILKGVIYQKLIKRYDNKERIAAFEVINVTSSVKNLIREGKIHQIQAAMQTGKKDGMMTIDMFLVYLYNKGYISKNGMLINCRDKSYIYTIF